MGIKNFSYARLQLDKTLPFNRPPLVTEWAKLNVNRYRDVANDESYEPLKYAEISHKVVEDVILNKEKGIPDVILIERQRIRSTSGKNVFEWIFRVNMLESMIHALLYSRKMTDKRLDGTTIISADPKRMGAYWSPLERGDDKKNNSKKYRLKLVEEKLKAYNHGNEKQLFALPPNSLSLSKEAENNRKSRSRTKWIYETVMALSDVKSQNLEEAGGLKDTKKGDDLVDSLLHGLAWYQWEKNKMILKLELRESIDDGIKFTESCFKRHFQDLQFLLYSEKENQAPKPRKNSDKV